MFFKPRYRGHRFRRDRFQVALRPVQIDREQRLAVAGEIVIARFSKLIDDQREIPLASGLLHLANG